MSRRTRSTILAATLAAGALATTSAPATASDATLKGEIESVLVELRPALEEFQSAAEGLANASSTTRLQEATRGFRNGLSRYKWGVVNRKASSDEGLTAKRVLLTAIRQYDIGLVQYERALKRIEAGSSRRSVLSALRTADRRFTAGLEDETAALTALGVEAQG